MEQDQGKLISAPRVPLTPANMIPTLEAQIEYLTTAVNLIKESCRFILSTCNNYDAMKAYVAAMEANRIIAKEVLNLGVDEID